jgi:hypothetical protein
MKLLVSFANPSCFQYGTKYLSDFRELMSKCPEIKLVEDCKEADAIMFIDRHITAGRRYYQYVDSHEYTSTYPEKVLIYDGSDQPSHYLRGLVTSMPQPLYDQQRHRPVPYVTNSADTVSVSLEKNRPIMVSFMGSAAGHPIRSKVLSLEHSGKALHIANTTDRNYYGNKSPTDSQLKQWKDEYMSLLQNSKFVLCPRGKGTATYRIYESLRLGAIPVIISDEFVDPEIPLWSTVTKRLAERNVCPKSILRLSADIDSSEIAKFYGDNFSTSTRGSFYHKEIQTLFSRGGKWKKQNSAEFATNQLYWLSHKVKKRIMSF